MPRIEWIELAGFRAFGKDPQRLDLSAPVAVLWGANSQGKTSLAEAMEFLFTGTIVRRELLASSQDEFADSLRNVHLPADTPVYVAAGIIGTDGTRHSIRRTLTADYSKRGPCSSQLHVDDVPAAQTALEPLGLKLSQPPLAAPVLMQHTLGYLFSARPQDRAEYFKALLEVTDLDALREGIASSASYLDAVYPEPLLGKLQIAAQHPDMAPALTTLLTDVRRPASIGERLSAAAAALLGKAGQTTPATSVDRFNHLRDLLAQLRAKTFPLQGFDRRPLLPRPAISDEAWKALDAFLGQVGQVSAETTRLLNLFQAVLQTPDISQMKEAVDCPVCEAPDALTPKRIGAIRDILEKNATFQSTRAAALTALQQIENVAKTVLSGLSACLPRAVGWSGDERKRQGFTPERMCELLPSDRHVRVDAWAPAGDAFAAASKTPSNAAANLRDLAAALHKDISTLATIDDLQTALAALQRAYDAFVTAHAAYEQAEEPLVTALRETVDQQSQTEGWQSLLDLVGHEAGLFTESLDRKSRQDLKQEFIKALREIDRAKELVLDQKFTDLSGHIKEWWELLRPNEVTFFSAVKPRAGAKRTIDFKAGLASDHQRTTVNSREAVAVFSYSQLHCLGLAAFLARAAREQIGLVILDDPVLSSDEDHRPAFMQSAAAELIRLGVQLIVITQDQRMWKDMGDLYAHLDIDLFQITLDEPIKGTLVVKTSDDLAVKLSRARPFLRSADPNFRKRGAGDLRDAAERFCKDLLVKSRRAQGDLAAMLTDYDGKQLGELIGLVEPLLTDPAHPGKLRVMAKTLNPGNHDDVVPSAGDLVHSHGDLMRFRKDYLQ